MFTQIRFNDLKEIKLYSDNVQCDVRKHYNTPRLTKSIIDQPTLETTSILQIGEATCIHFNSQVHYYVSIIRLYCQFSIVHHTKCIIISIKVKASRICFTCTYRYFDWKFVFFQVNFCRESIKEYFLVSSSQLDVCICWVAVWSMDEQVRVSFIFWQIWPWISVI